MKPQISNMTSPSSFFDVILFVLSNLATGPSFVSISSISYGIMRIFFYKGLTRNLEIGITPWVLRNIGRLGPVMDTKFGTMVSNRMLLNAAKLQGYSFSRFWVIKEKTTEGGHKIIVRPPPRLELSIDWKRYYFYHKKTNLLLLKYLLWETTRKKTNQIFPHFLFPWNYYKNLL